MPTIDIIIPALDEEASLPLVLSSLWELPRAPRRIIVVDNGSRDETASVAALAGALVVSEPCRGYGAACLRGIATVGEDPPDILVFMDADYSDFAEDLEELVSPIEDDICDFVVGSRLLGRADPGALPPHVRFGNKLASFLIRLTCGYRYTDLGPFRAIRYESLNRIGMVDRNFGWTVEMQVKAVRTGLRIAEVPVRYRRRIGVSKISGTITGTIKAGTKIIFSVFRYRYFG